MNHRVWIKTKANDELDKTIVGKTHGRGEGRGSHPYHGIHGSIHTSHEHIQSHVGDSDPKEEVLNPIAYTPHKGIHGKQEIAKQFPNPNGDIRDQCHDSCKIGKESINGTKDFGCLGPKNGIQTKV